MFVHDWSFFMSNDNKLLYAPERKEEIISILNNRKKISVPELCEHFQVSPSTIRNDLKELKEAGVIKRTHGGAILASKMNFETMPAQKEEIMLDEKKQIAEKAAELVVDGDTIAIDTGTTTLEFARNLINKQNLTIILNDLQIARFLEDNSDFHLIMLGGAIRSKFHYTYGKFSSDFLNQINVDKSFITCNGLSFTKGVTTPDMNLAEVKKGIMQTATESILLCDSSKFDRVAFSKIGEVSDFHSIVTDNKAMENDLNKLKETGVEVITT